MKKLTLVSSLILSLALLAIGVASCSQPAPAPAPKPAPAPAPAPAATSAPAPAPTTTPAKAPEQKWPAQLTVGNWQKGSDAYPSGVAIAQLVSKYTKSPAVVKEYAGGTPGIQALNASDCDIWGMGNFEPLNAYYGAKGTVWEGTPMEIFTLNYFWPMQFGIMVRGNDNINKVEDLVGKRVFCLFPAVPAETAAFKAVFDSYGIYDKINKMTITSPADMSTQMQNKTADAIFFTMAGSFIQEIKDATGIKPLDISQDALKFASSVPGFFPSTMSEYLLKNSFGLPTTAKFGVLTTAMSYYVNPKMADYVVYGILDALYGTGHIAEVKDLHWHLTEADIKLAASQATVPFHPGAIQYYKDKGVWSTQLDQLQKDLLAKARYKK